jgi:multidrug efflux pump subunit AcrA (membrane-fusion protein)
MSLVKKLFKKKRRFIILIVLFLVAIFVGYRLFLYKPPVNYITAKVERGNLRQTVSVTGMVVAKPTIDLSFQLSGKLASKNVAEGAQVKASDILAQLESADQEFQASQAEAVLRTAQANLNLKLVGASSEDIKVAQTNVASAKAILG